MANLGGPTAAAAQGFLSGFQAGANLRAQREQAERADLGLAIQHQQEARAAQAAELTRRINEVNLAKVIEEQAALAQGRQHAATLFDVAARPPVTEVVPERPPSLAVPPQPAPAPAMSDDDPFAGASLGVATPGIPGRPGRPAVTLAAHTPASLTQAVGGGANLASALRTPEGQAAYRMAAPMSAQDFEQAQRKRRAHAEAQEAFNTGGEHFTAHRPLEGAAAFMRAYRALADAGDDPTHAGRGLADWSREYERIHKDTEARERVADQLSRLGTAISRIGRPDADSDDLGHIVDAYAGVTEPTAVSAAARMIEPFKPRIEALTKRGAVSPDIAAFNVAVTERLTALHTGTTSFGHDEVLGAVRAAAAQHPAGAQKMIRLHLDDAKASPMPALYREALLAEVPEVKGTQHQVALSLATRAADSKNLVPGTPDYSTFVQTEYARLIRESRPPRAPVNPNTETRLTVSALDGQLRGVNTEIQRAKAEIEKARPSGSNQPIKPDQQAKITAAQGRLTKLEAQRTKLESQIAALQKQGAGSGADPAALKAARDQATETLFPGRAYPTLTPQEKQQVADRLNAGAR